MATKGYRRVPKLPSSLPRGTRARPQGHRFLGEESGEDWHRWAHRCGQIELDARSLPNHRVGGRKNRHRWRRHCKDWFALAEVTTDNHPTRPGAVQRVAENEHWPLQLLSWRRHLDRPRAVTSEGVREGTVGWARVQSHRRRREFVRRPETTRLPGTCSA